MELETLIAECTAYDFKLLPDGRKSKPEYAERAILEAMENHFIHRDYTVMGSEVHLDIYDDRLTVTSPGGMYNGLLMAIKLNIRFGGSQACKSERFCHCA